LTFFMADNVGGSDITKVTLVNPIGASTRRITKMDLTQAPHGHSHGGGH